jgi:hypothetical protein
MSGKPLTLEVLKYTLETLRKSNYNRLVAAKILDINRRSICDRIRLIKNAGLDVNDPIPVLSRFKLSSVGISSVDFERTKKSEQERLSAQQGFAPQYDLIHPIPNGLTLRGTSIKYDGNKKVQEYWNKTKIQGRDKEETVQLPDPKKIVKTATLYDQQGKVTQQWVSEKLEDVDREKLWKQFSETLAEALPKAEISIGPKDFNNKIMAAYVVSDLHLGLKTTEEESSTDFNIELSEKLLYNSIDYLIDNSPACVEALIACLGDFTHYDSHEPVTPTNRNRVDSDGRYPQMIRSAIRALRYLIRAALRKHSHVTIITEIGNHDIYTSVFLAECLKNIYENDPRVTVNTSARPFHFFNFGKVLIGTHHGHDVKMERLPLLMATDQSELWGKTIHRYWWTGHIHHRKSQSTIEQSQDYNGCSVESFRVLLPPDAWHYNNGYRPIRDMKSIILHQDYGEVGRNTVNPSMFEESH